MPKADTDITILLKARDKASKIIRASEKDMKRLVAVEKSHHRAMQMVGRERAQVERSHIAANKLLQREALLAKGATTRLGGMAGQLRTMLPLLGAAGLAGGVAAFVKSGVNFNKAIETATIQFGAFFPTVAESEKHVRSLAEFAAKTPFQLPGIIEASRLLKTFESDAAFGSDTLRVLGDAAAGVNAPLENVALWVGRMNTALDAGRPVGEAATRLQELGLLSGKARVELETLAKAGGSTKDVMGLLRAEWEKHEGAMVTMSESTKGLESTFFDLAAQVAGAAVSVTGLGTAYKTALEGMNAAMSGILLEGTPRLISQIETLNALIDDPRVSGRRLERYKRELIEAEAKLAALTTTTEDAVIATEDWHAGIGGLATEIPKVAGAIGTLHEPGTLTGNIQGVHRDGQGDATMYVGKVDRGHWQAGRGGWGLRGQWRRRRDGLR